jgi:histidinol-phosphate aminotransferase
MSRFWSSVVHCLSPKIADFRQPCSAILLPNPNAPIGIGLPREAIEALVVEHPDQLVVIGTGKVSPATASLSPNAPRL